MCESGHRAVAHEDEHGRGHDVGVVACDDGTRHENHSTNSSRARGNDVGVVAFFVSDEVVRVVARSPPADRVALRIG